MHHCGKDEGRCLRGSGDEVSESGQSWWDVACRRDRPEMQRVDDVVSDARSAEICGVDEGAGRQHMEVGEHLQRSPLPHVDLARHLGRDIDGRGHCPTEG